MKHHIASFRVMYESTAKAIDSHGQELSPMRKALDSWWEASPASLDMPIMHEAPPGHHLKDLSREGLLRVAEESGLLTEAALGDQVESMRRRLETLGDMSERVRLCGTMTRLTARWDDLQLAEIVQGNEEIARVLAKRVHEADGASARAPKRAADESAPDAKRVKEA
jgi:hypothetical protein